MAVNYNYIKENIEEFCYDNVRLDAISNFGIAINLSIPAEIDLLDFIEELGVYFYRIDDPKFGQKFINEENKLYIYDWLTQILNTGNYEEDEEDGTVFVDLELYMNIEKLNTFKYALRKYKEKYKQDTKKNIEYSRVYAEKTAINILELIEKIRLTTIC